MKPYSQDLRKRVLAQVKAGKQTQAHIAAAFDVSPSTVEKWWRRKRETGKATPLPPPHGPKRALQDHRALLRAAVKKQPDITLGELCARVATHTGVQVSASTMCRELQALGLPRKKSRFMTVSATPHGSAASAERSGSGSPRSGVGSSNT